MIQYHSTRGENKRFRFSEVILKGIASDGGLYVPEKIPFIDNAQLGSLIGKSYQELTQFVFEKFETDFRAEVLKRLIKRAYGKNFDHSEITPLHHLKDNRYILELFHGPTSAFKDVALQLTTCLFSESLKNEQIIRRNKKLSNVGYLIIVATSGDTGKAALAGYKNKKGTDIIVFYPENRVSKIQELSMITQKGNNVGVYGVEGDFDEVQKIIKETYGDKAFTNRLLEEKKLILSSANSINWGRLFPQIIYHFRSYIDLVKKKTITLGKPIDIAVPTGNFGNILAGYYAKKMGLPIRKLICASNENNVYTKFLQTGSYDVRNKKIIKTPSPSMDILIGSNLERLLFELTHDCEKVAGWLEELNDDKSIQLDISAVNILKEYFYADWVSNSDCLNAIGRVYEESKYVIDPHTAVALEVVRRYKKSGDSTPVVICATAHWSKFPQDVYSGLKGTKTPYDEFTSIRKIKELNPQIYLPENIIGLKNNKILHRDKVKATKNEVEKAILRYLSDKLKRGS